MPMRPSFSEATGLIDPAKTYNYRLVFPFIPGVGGYDARSVSVRILEVPLPGFENENIKIDIATVSINHSGRPQYQGTMSITVLELRDTSTRQLFEGWLRYKQDEQSNSGSFKADYSVTADLFLFDDIPNEIAHYKIINAHVQAISEVQLGQTSDAIKYNITLVYDAFVPESLAAGLLGV